MKNIVFTFMDVKNETCPSTKAALSNEKVFTASMVNN
jgi:hypothetical protein